MSIFHTLTTYHMPGTVLGIRVLLVFLVSFIFTPFPFTLSWAFVNEFHQVFLLKSGRGGRIQTLQIRQHDAFMRHTFSLLIWPPLMLTDLLFFSRRVFVTCPHLPEDIPRASSLMRARKEVGLESEKILPCQYYPSFYCCCLHFFFSSDLIFLSFGVITTFRMR